MDIFVLTGTLLAGAPPKRHQSPLQKQSRRNFHRRDAKAPALPMSAGRPSVCVGDYNNDGFEDLFVTYWGQNKLYRNNGDGTFTDVTKAAGLIGRKTRWGAGCTFVDYNRDGHLDLFVSNYRRFRFQARAEARRQRRLQLERHPGQLRPARIAARNALALPQQRQRHFHRRQRSIGHRQISTAAME